MSRLSTRRVSRRVATRTALSASLLLATVFITAAPAHGATIYVNAGDNFQHALNAAQPGDEIVLQAGATFTGSFVLPPKPEGPAIRVRTSATLPARRVTPGDAALMPKIGSGSADPAIDGNGARNWTFEGIQFLANTGGLYNIIYTHANATNITFDRVLILGGPNGQKNAIAGNGANITLTRSHIANIYEFGNESHGFVAWDGPGPFTIRDNYIEAASINILFGGADSSSPAHVPADILVENNHLVKRLEWRNTGRAVKNLFELKSAKRVTVRNNLMENNWSDAQNGYAILFTTRNDAGGSPWAVVQDVVFAQNIVRGTEGGVNLLGINDGDPSGQANNIAIRHNLFICSGNFLIAGGEVGDVAVEHNTIRNSGTMLMTLYKGLVWPAGGSVRGAQYAIRSLTFRNNLAYHNDYGVFGDEGLGQGTTALTALTRAYNWTHNVLANGGTNYPAVNWYPSASDHQAQFNADYTLATGSIYRSAGSDGQDLGVVWTAAPEPPVTPTNPPVAPTSPPPAPAPAPFAVVALTLVNAQTGIDIGPADNAVVPVGVAVAIRATTNPAVVGSVRFNVNGVINVETAAPYAMPGDSAGVFHAWHPAAGTYTVTATPFEGPSATGAEGTSRTITLRVAPPETCGNGTDDDLDGLVDEGCAPPPPPPAEVCGNGIDDDRDGLIDEGCAPPPPPPAEVCGNGVDDDLDGQVDEGCAPPPPPPAEVCGDNVDNDGDGLIDEGCPVVPADTTGPVVTFNLLKQTPNAYRFRVSATDPSGIASVRVLLNDAVAYSGASVPVDVELSLRLLRRGTHRLTIAVVDKAGNTTTQNRTLTK